jgi:hypothetical protein
MSKTLDMWPGKEQRQTCGQKIKKAKANMGMYLYVVTVLLLMVMVNMVRLNYVKRTERDHDNARNN